MPDNVDLPSLTFTAKVRFDQLGKIRYVIHQLVTLPRWAVTRSPMARHIHCEQCRPLRQLWRYSGERQAVIQPAVKHYNGRGRGLRAFMGLWRALSGPAQARERDVLQRPQHLAYHCTAALNIGR